MRRRPEFVLNLQSQTPSAQSDTIAWQRTRDGEGFPCPQLLVMPALPGPLLREEQNHGGREQHSHNDVERAKGPLPVQHALQNGAKREPGEAARQRGQHKDECEHPRLLLRGAAARVEECRRGARAD